MAARSGARSNHDWGAHPCTRVSEGGGRRTISGGLVVSVCFPCPPERALRSEWLRSPRPMSGEGLAAQKSSRSAAPAPATKQKKQRIDRAGLDNDELVRLAGGDDEAEKMDEEDTEVETVEEGEGEEVEEGLLHRSELNKTGYKGVTHMLKMKKFRAMETGPQGKCLGYFDTAKKAAVCYAKHMKSQEGAQEASIRPSPSDDDDDDDGDDNDDDDDDDEEATGDDEDDNDDAGSQPDRCERNPQCTRGYKHGGNGGRCSLPRLLQLSRAVAEAPRRHDASSTSTQTCNRALTPASAPPSPYY